MRRLTTLAAIALAACGGNDQTASVFSVSIASGGGLLVTSIGGTLQLTATPLDAAGHAVKGVAVTWSSSSTSVATVDANGLVTALANGTADITAAAAGASGRTTVTVAQAADTVAVNPPSATIERGATQTFTAAVTDAHGHAVPDAAVTWTSSDEAIATISTDGVATGIATGQVTITATDGSKSATATLDVTVPAAASVAVTATESGSLASLGDTRQLTASAKDARDAAIAEATFSWSSSDDTIASVSGTGLVTAKKNGTATITATSGSAHGSLDVTVQQVLHSVSVTPATQSIAPDALFTFAAHLLDANSHPLGTPPAVTWTIADSDVATIDAGTGEVHGNALATAVVSTTVRATAQGGLFGEATLTVDPAMAPVVSIDLPQPASSLASIGDTVQLAATAKNQAGNAVPDVVFSWSSDHPDVATVDTGTGLVTAAGNGTATITASGGGKSASVTVTVLQVVTAVVLSPPSTTTLTSIDQTLQLTASANDANGHAVTAAPMLWTTSAAAIATVSNTGLVTAKGNGTPVTIKATSGSFHDQVDLTVQQAIAAVNITPANDAVPPDSTLDFSAAAVDAHGHLVAGAGAASFQSDNGLVVFTGATATIGHTATQVVVNITATVDSVPGTTQLTVDPALVPVDHIVVTVAAGSLSLASIGDTVQLSAQAQDAANNPLARTISWSIQDGSADVVTVNQSGLVTAVSNGTRTVVASAGGKSGTVSATVAQVLASIQVSTAVAGASTTLASFGDTLPLQATGFDANNHAISGLTGFGWSSDSAHATIDADTGVVTAVSDGGANITATLDSTTSPSFAVTVAQTVDHIAIATADDVPATLASLGATLQLEASAFDARDNLMTETFTWGPTTGAAATVDPSGLVTAVSNGNTSVQASAGGKTGSLPVAVAQVAVSVSLSGAASLTSLGQTAQLTATAADANGHAVSGATFSWRSDNAGAVSVDASTGVITAVAVGSANVFAKDGAVESGAYPITVAQVVAHINVTGQASIDSIGDTRQLSASAVDANAHPVPGVSFTWAIQDASTDVITVNASGLVSAVGNGQRTVVASGAGTSGTLLVIVSQVAASVAVSTGGGSTSFTSIGDTLQLTASAADANGHPITTLTNADFTWRSDSAHATVSASGLVTAVSNGSANIFAKIGGFESSGTGVTLTQVVASVVVTPANPKILSGHIEEFTATPSDARGHVMTGNANWASSDTSVATISGTGLATGNATIEIAETTTITGTIAGVHGSTVLTVAGPGY